MNINKNDIMKTAASHLRNLSAEVLERRKEIEKGRFVDVILEKVAEDLTGLEILEKRAEYMNKELEELKVIEKALELSKTGELHLGSLSTQVADNGDLDPLTAMLVEGYDLQ